MKNSISIHPDWGESKKYYIDKSATKLIIGSMPPFRLCIGEDGNKRKLENGDIDFFYGSKDNYFWKILNCLNNKDNNKQVSFDNINTSHIKNADECKKLLKDNNIGILDIVQKCIHNDGLASDNDLLSIDKIDLIKILKEYKNINTIFCTSNFVKQLLEIYYAVKIEYINKYWKIYLSGIEKPYELYILYSPTKRVFNRFKNDKEIYMANYYKLFDLNKKMEEK